MKTLRNVVARNAAITALYTGIVFAQGQFGPGNATPPDPATMIANQVARLTTLLDLTTGQATSITGILTTAQSSIAPLQTTLHTDQSALAAAITSNTTATIDSLSAAIGTIQGEILDINSKAEGAIYALLSTTQQTKVTTLGGLVMLGGGHGGPGGPGRGPGH